VTFIVEWQPTVIVHLTIREDLRPREKMIFPRRRAAVAAMITIRKESTLL
jgi:hypothetical protein